MPRAVSLLFALMLATGSGVRAADTPVEFASPAQQVRYAHLLDQLRCLVCQNQTLADSQADLAQDLRNEVTRMICEGRDDDAIRAFLVSRYGEFVLYEPPLQATTVALWAGPPLLLLVITLIWRRVVRGAQTRISAPITSAERAVLSSLTDRPH